MPWIKSSPRPPQTCVPDPRAPSSLVARAADDPLARPQPHDEVGPAGNPQHERARNGAHLSVAADPRAGIEPHQSRRQRSLATRCPRGHRRDRYRRADRDRQDCNQRRPGPNIDPCHAATLHDTVGEQDPLDNNGFPARRRQEGAAPASPRTITARPRISHPLRTMGRSATRTDGPHALRAERQVSTAAARDATVHCLAAWPIAACPRRRRVGRRSELRARGIGGVGSELLAHSRSLLARGAVFGVRAGRPVVTRSKHGRTREADRAAWGNRPLDR